MWTVCAKSSIRNRVELQLTLTQYLLPIKLQWSGQGWDLTHKCLLCKEGESDTCWQHFYFSNHLKHPLLQWGHNHFHTEGQQSPEKQGRSRTDSTHFPIPASQLRGHEDNAHYQGWRVVGTELHLVPPPRFETKKATDTRQQGSKRAPTPNEDWHPVKTQHPPRQTSLDTTDDAHRYSAARQHGNILICPSQTCFFSLGCLSLQKHLRRGKKNTRLPVTPLIL